jgi:putative MATE family efflux protein
VEAVPAGAPAAPSLLYELRNRDHTNGSLLVSLVILSLPSLLTTVGGFGLFQLVDLRFLGQLGADAVAAAGATNQTLRQFFFLFVMGMSVASQMLIARFVGEGRIYAAEHVAGQTFLLGAALSAVCAGTGLLFAQPLVSLVARDAEVVALGVVYVRIALLLLFTTIFVQLGTSVLSGAGDTTTPMLVSLLITPVSIGAEWVLAFGHLGLPRLGIAGIAIGAALGGGVGLAALLWALSSGRCRVHIRRRHLVPDGAALRRILSLVWQPALHMLARTTIVFFFMWLAGLLGGKVQAAYTIGLRIELPAFMVAFTIANACATLVGQNLGAGRLDRSWRSIWVSYGVELSLLWPTAAALFLFRHELVAFFTDDPEVMRLAAELLVFSSVVMSFYGLYFVSFRALQASGDMNTPMLISVGAAVLVGAPLGYYLSTQTQLGATGMWIGNLAYSVTNAALMVGYLLTGRWARRLGPAARARVPIGGGR